MVVCHFYECDRIIFQKNCAVSSDWKRYQNSRYLILCGPYMLQPLIMSTTYIQISSSLLILIASILCLKILIHYFTVFQISSGKGHMVELKSNV
jgi:hypothetical protein